MLLKDTETGSLVEILDLQALIDPNTPSVSGQGQAGQEEQNAESFQKETLKFPSGEDLPLCWKDANYPKV